MSPHSRQPTRATLESQGHKDPQVTGNWEGRGEFIGQNRATPSHVINFGARQGDGIR
ncbi:hypothetical protein PM082_008629 [Marasmius tenuissimus]|nr:hypothetical protein PM082_008629 [Marasmius tenuissimus]